jgi:5-formyltetrahydrofolate cyclo-ligase
MTSESDPGDYASPPCFLHELDSPSCSERSNVLRWRKSERERLLALRLALPREKHGAFSSGIAANLDAIFPDLTGRSVSLYWPLRGEPDLRPWASAIEHRGARCCLPVVVEKAAPLKFVTWHPGEQLVRGFWNIPVPPQGVEIIPDIVFAPVIGYDEKNFRLGYGGGYFDRTLAALPMRPRVIGIGFSISRIRTIYPLGHDIPMDMLVTETVR